MNYQQQIMYLRKSRGLIIICLLAIVLVLTTAFIAVQAEAASIEISPSAEYDRQRFDRTVQQKHYRCQLCLHLG